jgi:triphosphoribosyl-dephospho-CoA synthase
LSPPRGGPEPGSLPLGATARSANGASMTALRMPGHATHTDAHPIAVEAAVQRIGRTASVALYDELALAPKPGLVSFIDSGSHDDMDAQTFLRSLNALRPYFVRIARLGAQGATFAQLRASGMRAEACMLQATSGVNTHRGAIFSLGLLCASAGWHAAQGQPLHAAGLRNTLLRLWGADLACHAASARSASNGRTAAQRFSLRSAAHEAALGFPTLFETALPALRAARRQGLGTTAARLQLLFTLIAELDDTNLAHRGGATGLRFAQQTARGWLQAGGAAAGDAIAHAEASHRAFVARRLSPGGSADLLAAACWVERVCRGR